MKNIFQKLYVQVLIGIVLGVCAGYFFPEKADSLKFFGEAFIRLVKMLIAPIIFSTVVLGITRTRDMKEVGRVGMKALIYFEILTTIALAIGLVIVNIFKPGAGVNADLSKLDTSVIAPYTQSAHSMSTSDFFLNIIPTNVVDAFAKGEILQVLLFSILFGFALSRLGKRAELFVHGLEIFSDALFKVIALIMRLAPIGAFGAMAFTVAKFGPSTLMSLGQLMLVVYASCTFFIFVVLGIVARIFGFNILKILGYIREEILIVLGTSSSESVLPQLISKLERAGCAQSVVGLVVPTGYSFNLDGTSIYLTAAVLFIAQATNTPMSLEQQLTTLGILLITSKGAAAVTGGGFITLAATLASLHTIPVEGIALLIGVDRFMSEARAITNLIGNTVAALVISKWEQEYTPNEPL